MGTRHGQIDGKHGKRDSCQSSETVVYNGPCALTTIRKANCKGESTPVLANRMSNEKYSSGIDNHNAQKDDIVYGQYKYMQARPSTGACRTSTRQELRESSSPNIIEHSRDIAFTFKFVIFV